MALSFLRARARARVRAHQAPQALFPKESSGLAAWLKRIVAKKALECIGQFFFAVKFGETNEPNTLLPKVRSARIPRLAALSALVALWQVLRCLGA